MYWIVENFCVQQKLASFYKSAELMKQTYGMPRKYNKYKHVNLLV